METKLWGIIWRLVSAGSVLNISKTTQNLILTCCYDIMAETIIGKVKEVKINSIICDDTFDASNRGNLSFCLRYVNDNGDICENLVKFIYYKSGLTGKKII